MSPRVQNALLCLATYIIGVVFIVMTGDLDYPSNVFPYLVSITILVFTTVIFLTRVVSGPRGKPPGSAPDDSSKVAVLRVFLTAVVCVVYVILIPYGGFYFTSTVFLLALFLGADPKNFSYGLLMKASGLTAAVLLTVYLVFTFFLNVPTPRGVLL